MKPNAKQCILCISVCQYRYDINIPKELSPVMTAMQNRIERNRNDVKLMLFSSVQDAEAERFKNKFNC